MAILATDNFTRADNASLGSPWNPNTGDSDANGFKIASNTAQPDNVTQDSSEGNSAVTWPTDYYVEVTYGTTNADGLGAGSGPSCYQSITAKTMYRAVANASGSELLRFNAGVSGSLFSSAGTTFASGDKLRLEVRKNGANIDWVLKKNSTQYASGTDTSALTTSAQAGIAHSSTSTTGAITFWEGGDFTSGGPAKAATFRAGRGPSTGPSMRRMRPQQFPVTVPDPILPTIDAPFHIGGGRGERGFPQRRMLPQRYPDVSAAATTILAPTEGAITIAGVAASLTLILAAASGAITISGNAPSISTILQGVVGSVVIGGNAPSTTTALLPSVGAVTIGGNAPSTTLSLAPTVGAVTIGGLAPSLTKILAATEGAVVIGGSAPSIAVGTVLSPSEGNIALAGNAPDLLTALTASEGSVLFSGNTPTVVAPVATEEISSSNFSLRKWRQWHRKEDEAELRKLHLTPAVAEVIAEVAERQAQTLETSERERIKELTRELELKRLRFQARYLELLNVERQQLIDAEIKEFYEAKTALDEENKRRLLLLLAFLS